MKDYAGVPAKVLRIQLKYGDEKHTNSRINGRQTIAYVDNISNHIKEKRNYISVIWNKRKRDEIDLKIDQTKIQVMDVGKKK